MRIRRRGVILLLQETISLLIKRRGGEALCQGPRFSYLIVHYQPLLVVVSSAGLIHGLIEVGGGSRFIQRGLVAIGEITRGVERGE